MTDSHHVLERVVSLRREMLGSALSVQALAGLKWPTQCGRVSLPKESNHVLEEVASCHHEALSFVLSVRTLAGLEGKHNVDVFHCRRRAAKKNTNADRISALSFTACPRTGVLQSSDDTLCNFARDFPTTSLGTCSLCARCEDEF